MGDTGFMSGFFNTAAGMNNKTVGVTSGIGNVGVSIGVQDWAGGNSGLLNFGSSFVSGLLGVGSILP
jgi:hypothetical protein